MPTRLQSVFRQAMLDYVEHRRSLDPAFESSLARPPEAVEYCIEVQAEALPLVQKPLARL